MKIGVETHSHTVVSGHAYNTMKEMILAAKEKGLEGIALTEHAPEMLGACCKYYFQNYKVVPREQYGMKVLLGVELNILNEAGDVDLEDDILKKQDIVIASIHSGCFQGNGEKDIVTKGYLNVMKNPYVHIIGHPDDGRFPIDYDQLVQGAKETNTLLEINNTSLSPNAFRTNGRENVIKLLKKCKEYQVPVVLGSDAHVEYDVGSTSYSLPLLKECDFPEGLVANTTYEKLMLFIAKS